MVNNVHTVWKFEAQYESTQFTEWTAIYNGRSAAFLSIYLDFKNFSPLLFFCFLNRWYHLLMLFHIHIESNRFDWIKSRLRSSGVELFNSIHSNFHSIPNWLAFWPTMGGIDWMKVELDVTSRPTRKYWRDFNRFMDLTRMAAKQSSRNFNLSTLFHVRQSNAGNGNQIWNLHCKKWNQLWMLFDYLFMRFSVFFLFFFLFFFFFLFSWMDVSMNWRKSTECRAKGEKGRSSPKIFNHFIWITVFDIFPDFSDGLSLSSSSSSPSSSSPSSFSSSCLFFFFFFDIIILKMNDWLLKTSLSLLPPPSISPPR